MTRFARKVHVGSAPGVLRAPQVQRVDSTSISVMRYSPAGCDETSVESAADLAPFAASFGTDGGMTWIDIVGLHDIQMLEEIGQLFGIHLLALEDIANVGQRPKLEEYGKEEGGHLFLVLRNFHHELAPAEAPSKAETTDSDLVPEQISLFVRPGLVLSFQEIPGDCFEPVRERIRIGNARIRSRGADYLTYALVDALVDSFYPLLEHLGEKIEDLEEELMGDASPENQDVIHSLRRNLLQVRRAAWPMREMTKSLLREGLPLFTDETRLFLRDCYDHSIEVLEITETYREMGTSLQEVFLSSVSQKMNEVMKVLTIIATIFIPLTFIAGIYGMNFQIMPELNWPWAYHATLVLMAVIGLGLVAFFRRKGWM